MLQDRLRRVVGADCVSDFLRVAHNGQVRFLRPTGADDRHVLFTLKKPNKNKAFWMSKDANGDIIVEHQKREWVMRRTCKKLAEIIEAKKFEQEPRLDYYKMP